MRALVRTRSGVAVASVATPRALAADEVLIRVAVAGLCRTDCLVAAGELAATAATRILGHELAGTVVARGVAAAVELGAWVSVDPRLPCGGCSACALARTCDQPRFLGVDVDGAFAEYVRVPIRNVILAPPGLDPRAIAYTEPVAATLAVLDAGIQPDQPGLVVGSGRIAALTLAVLRAHGFTRVEAVDPERDPKATDELEFAIEARNDAATLAWIVARVRAGGRIVIKSRTATPLLLDPLALIRKRMHLVAVDYGSFTDAVALLAGGRLAIEDLWTEPRPLDDHAALFAEAARGEGRKLFFAL